MLKLLFEKIKYLIIKIFCVKIDVVKSSIDGSVEWFCGDSEVGQRNCECCIWDCPKMNN